MSGNTQLLFSVVFRDDIRMAWDGLFSSALLGLVGMPSLIR